MTRTKAKFDAAIQGCQLCKPPGVKKGARAQCNLLGNKILTVRPNGQFDECPDCCTDGNC